MEMKSPRRGGVFLYRYRAGASMLPATSLIAVLLATIAASAQEGRRHHDEPRQQASQIRVKVITTVSCNSDEPIAAPAAGVTVEFQDVSKKANRVSVATPAEGVARVVVSPGTYVVTAHLNGAAVGTVNFHVTKESGAGTRYKARTSEGGVSLRFSSGASNPQALSEYEIGIRMVTCGVGQPAHDDSVPKVRATVAEIGEAMVVERDGGEGPAFAGMELRDGDKITVRGKAKLDWAGGGTIAFESSRFSGKPTIIVIDPHLGRLAKPPDSSYGIKVLQGFLHVLIPKGDPPKRTKFEASTGTVVVAVKGTDFNIWYDGETKVSRVWVEEGTVVVSPINLTTPPVTLLAGQQVEVTQEAVGQVTRVPSSRGGQGAATATQGEPPQIEKPSSLSGNWIMSDGSPVYLRQDGARVTGSYQSGQEHAGLSGKLSGTFNGKFFRGSYQNSGGGVFDAGTFQLALTAEGKLTGRWFSTSAKGQEGSWTLSRAPK